MAAGCYRVKSNNYLTERLFVALTQEDVTTVQTLLLEGADIDARNSKGHTPLLLACILYRRTIFDLCIESGANVDCCDGHGLTVLHYASKNCWSDLISYLVKKVPDINVQDISGDTAMHHASRSGYFSVVKCLLEEGADIDRKNFVEFTPLLYAAKNKFKKIFDVLLNARANVDGNEGLLLYYATRNGWTDMVQSLVKRLPDLSKIGDLALNATSSRGYLELLKYLVEEGTDNTKMICQAVLHEASTRGHLEVVKWLVKKRSNMKIVLDLNARNEKGRIALLSAIEMEHVEVAKYLVEEGSDVNVSDECGRTALQVASRDGYQELVKCLVKKGAHVNVSNVYGNTALHNATNNGHIEIVKYLVEKGACINTRNECGETLLHIATYLGYLEIVKYFVEKGIDNNAKSSSRHCSNYTSLIFATEFLKKDIADLLMYFGANVDGLNENKETMLHMASARGWKDMVHSLLKKGCDLEARNLRGNTALGCACKFERSDTVQYLLQAGARWDVVDIAGNSPLNYLTRKKRPELKPIKLFIDKGAYLNRIDYDAIVKNSSLEVLQGINLCCQSILNKFNNSDLYDLYKLPVSGSLPCVEKLKITSGSEVAQAIEQTLKFEIQTKGHCNILEICPMALGVFSVRSILEYYEKKEMGIEKSVKAAASI